MGIAGSITGFLTVDEVIERIAEYFHSRRMTVKDAFRFLDGDCNGWVSWEEFLRGVQLCVEGHYVLDPAQLYQVFVRFDVNGDGRMSIQEFASAFSPSQPFGRTWDDADHYARGLAAAQAPAVTSAPPPQPLVLPPLPSPGEPLAPVPPQPSLKDRIAQEVIDRIAGALTRTGHTPQELFARLDHDRNGRLSQFELQEILLSLQPDLSVTEREAVYERFDRDRNGSVDLVEFQQALQGVCASTLVAVEDKIALVRKTFAAQGFSLYDSFSVFDRNADGYLSREEWARAMDALGISASLTPADVEAVFRRFDVNGDGYMSITEFQQFFENSIDRRSTLPAVVTPGEWPRYEAAPVEAPWETEILDLVRTCLSAGRCGMSITEVWRRLDVDRSNSMSYYEFCRVIATYRPELSQEALQSLFYKVNTSKTGTITMSEFVRRFG